MLLCCLGGRKKRRKHHTLSYAHALVNTESESIEAAVRKRGIRKSIVRGFVARMGETRLPTNVVLGEMVRGKGHSFRQEKDWMGRLEEDLTEFGIESEG